MACEKIGPTKLLPWALLNSLIQRAPCLIGNTVTMAMFVMEMLANKYLRPSKQILVDRSNIFSS